MKRRAKDSGGRPIAASHILLDVCPACRDRADIDEFGNRIGCGLCGGSRRWIKPPPFGLEPRKVRREKERQRRRDGRKLRSMW